MARGPLNEKESRMRILLLNPPFLPRYSRFSRSPAVTKSGTIYYPIWHAYAAGLLERAGHEVMLVDAPARGLSREECYRLAGEFMPEMTVVYTSTPSIYNDVEVASCVKERLPGTFTVLTGPHVSALPEESLALDQRVDAVARLEYDLTLVDLAARLLDGSHAATQGLTLRVDGSIRSNLDRPYLQDMDSLPFVSEVYKRHLRIEDYFYAHCRYPVVSIFTSRGCNARCVYCVYPQQAFGRRQRQRSPESIVAEFEYIEKELPQAREVLIDDDTFSVSQEHTLEFCELMAKKRIRLPWTVECRANLGFETMRAMKRAGCRLIVAGFESADDTVLRKMRKGVTVERMRRFSQDAKRAGVMLHACFMAGNMGETRETLMKSLAFAKELGADTCQFFPLMVYPGTEAYRWAEENSYLTTRDFREWLTPEGLHNCVVSTPELAARDLVDFCDRARRSYYLGPKYIMYKLKQGMRDPQELKKTIKSARIFARYLFRRAGGRAEGG
ncbi:MAG TPA: B12-binding domain-containing radical SAM protein [Deltaproteobacteria bacterium]|nr:B12-binding domain-containing radical SAM protein [Deltaproteobacteria bacterium]HCY11492.1 B12-binding domain-containing radical SAM protein [Deltaproteobacteria bacterium]